MKASIRRLAALMLLAFCAVALGLTYWQVVRAGDLVYSPNNGRLVEEERRILRGQILDTTGRRLAYSDPTPEGTVRRYEDPTLANTIGYVSERYGAAGLEASFGRYLRGDVQADPLESILKDAIHTRRVGDDLILTIDPRVQSVAARVMGSDRGAVVAMDPRTGAILAMVSTPYYDPNRLDDDWQRLLDDPARPLLNRATQGLYTPGSVFKIVTASAAIDLGLVDLNKRYRCTEDLTVDGFVIKNKNHPGVENVTFVDDFAYSCNVTFAKTGLGLGFNPLPIGDNIPDPAPWTKGIEESRRRFLDYARRFGLEAPIPFDLPTSVSTVGKTDLNRVELASTAFGQGELLVSPLQMALAAATIANGGQMPQPYLVSEVRDPSGRVVVRHQPQTIRQVVSSQTASSVNRLMIASVQEGYAKPAGIPGIQVAGKTGSAEVAAGERTHSWFIGYAPADNPMVAVAVVMENKGPGSDFATPAGREVIRAALSR